MDKSQVLDHTSFDVLQRIRIVLSRPSHPGNIGSAARAMKTMGLSRLYLVEPKHFPDPQADTLASGAVDVLQQATVCHSLDEALQDVTVAAALTSRRRELAADLHPPRTAVADLLALARSGQEVALVFGNETFGLSIEEVERCNLLVTIPGNPAYFSLNLAQAVQVMCYEVFQQYNDNLDHLRPNIDLATREEVQGFYRHLATSLEDIGFFRRRNSDRLMRRLSTLFDRARLQREEVDILRGMCKQMQYLAQHQPNDVPPSTLNHKNALLQENHAKRQALAYDLLQFCFKPLLLCLILPPPQSLSADSPS